MDDDRKELQCVEGDVLSKSGTPDKSGRIRLGNIRDVRHEAAKVYRDARMGLIPTHEGTRLVYILLSLSSLIKDSELEARVIKLEKAKHD